MCEQARQLMTILFPGPVVAQHFPALDGPVQRVQSLCGDHSVAVPYADGSVKRSFNSLARRAVEHEDAHGPHVMHYAQARLLRRICRNP